MAGCCVDCVPAADRDRAKGERPRWSVDAAPAVEEPIAHQGSARRLVSIVFKIAGMANP